MLNVNMLFATEHSLLTFTLLHDIKAHSSFASDSPVGLPAPGGEFLEIWCQCLRRVEFGEQEAISRGVIFYLFYLSPFLRAAIFSRQLTSVAQRPVVILGFTWKFAALPDPPSHTIRSHLSFFNVVLKSVHVEVLSISCNSTA